ncbi:MAG: hypothetical protein HKN86_04340 [Acidimicrobiia bacterium]|nr:hypothetical protein [Acidimicrobiia bacterium]
MINIYWPVYKNLEDELNELMFSIHIDDNQLTVYSMKIAHLIIRAVTEIESISKELYLSNGGQEKKFIRFDDVALKHLDRQWFLKDKVVIISSPNCFVSDLILKPFIKKEKRSGLERLTYTWNNAYQNLKHNRAGNIQFGSLGYLFDSMAALYLLNIYYKSDNFELGKDSAGTSFDESLGSSVFSISVFKNCTASSEGIAMKGNNLNECSYIIKPTDKTAIEIREAFKRIDKKRQELTTNHLQTILTDIIGQKKDILPEIIKDIRIKLDEEKENLGDKFMIQAARSEVSSFNNLKYECVINKNQSFDLG